MKEIKNKKKKAYHSRYTFCRWHLDKQILQYRDIQSSLKFWCTSCSWHYVLPVTESYFLTSCAHGPLPSQRPVGASSKPSAPGFILRSQKRSSAPVRGWHMSTWAQRSWEGMGPEPSVSLVYTSGRLRATALPPSHNHVAFRTQQGGSRTQAETQHSFKNIQDPKKVLGGIFFFKEYLESNIST